MTKEAQESNLDDEIYFMTTGALLTTIGYLIYVKITAGTGPRIQYQILHRPDDNELIVSSRREFHDRHAERTETDYLVKFSELENLLFSIVFKISGNDATFSLWTVTSLFTNIHYSPLKSPLFLQFKLKLDQKMTDERQKYR